MACHFGKVPRRPSRPHWCPPSRGRAARSVADRVAGTAPVPAAKRKRLRSSQSLAVANLLCLTWRMAAGSAAKLSNTSNTDHHAKSRLPALELRRVPLRCGESMAYVPRHVHNQAQTLANKQAP